ncbi:MAG: Na-translocating system protein MpsC family protein [Deferrisomatales bacterium]
MDDRTRIALTEGIALVCRDALGATPEAVELHGSDDLVFAVLRHCLPPAEEVLARRSEGRGLLREYHDACSREVLPALGDLVRRAAGRELRSAALEPVRGTRHKLLVLVLADPPGPAPHPPIETHFRQEEPL